MEKGVEGSRLLEEVGKEGIEMKGGIGERRQNKRRLEQRKEEGK